MERALEVALQQNKALGSKAKQDQDELADLMAALSDQQDKVDGLERLILELRSDLRSADRLMAEARTKSDRVIESKNRHIAMLEERNLSVKSSPTYRLGNAIISATKSWSGFLALPNRLRAIHEQGNQRRKLRASNGFK